MVSALLAGTVLERDGAAYRVATPDGEVRAILRGKARRDAPRVVVGDRVRLEAEQAGGLFAIAEVEPRRSLLERRIPLGRGTRPIAANIDAVFVVTASRDPVPVPQLIDRLLVVAEANELPATVR
jgi:putative ribosome biogenesis GTPase RsgA